MGCFEDVTPWVEGVETTLRETPISINIFTLIRCGIL